MDDGIRAYDIFCFDGIFERRCIDAIVSTKRLRVSLKNMKEVILAIYEIEDGSFKYTNLQIRPQVPPALHERYIDGKDKIESLRWMIASFVLINQDYSYASTLQVFTLLYSSVAMRHRSQ